MSISAADLKPLKTQSQKAHQAYLNDLGIGIGAEEAARRQEAPPKPRGQKPLYHEHFGQYFFWVVTGKGSSEMDGSAEEYYGPTRSQQHFGSITRWVSKLLGEDKEELTFNQYAYLKDLLQQQVQQYGDDALHFQRLMEWLQEQADKADVYACLFSPPRYNVRTLLDAGERDLSGPLNIARPLENDEKERLEYYQLIEKKRARIAEEYSMLCEQLQAANRQATDEELQLLSRFEKQLEFLALNQLDQLDYNRLQARANRERNAAEFKAGLEERLLQSSPSGLDLILKYPGSFQPDPDSETGLFPPRVIFTLSELTREFDANIELYGAPSSRAAYAAKQLMLFDINRPRIVRHFDPWLEMDALKVTALNQVLTELRSLYEQHQHRKLRSFRSPVSNPEIAKFKHSNLENKKSEDKDLSKLFIAPFTSSNLTELLQHLKVVNSSGDCITNDLKGSGQGKRSRFTAAYRVLQREKLLNATEHDSVWASAFKKLYGAKLEEKAISQQLKANGHPATGCSKQFEEGVKEAKEWVEMWRESQKREDPFSR